MSKKGVIVVIVAAVVAAGGIVAAYSAGYFVPESNTTPVINTVERAEVFREPENDSDQASTSIAEDNEHASEPRQAASNGTIANNTLIVINKPVYRNETVIYEPVTINLEEYRTTINQKIKIEDNDRVTIEDGGTSPPASKPVDKSYSITVHAKRAKSPDWSAKFTDDRTGMFVAVYDMKGKLVKTGFADERGLAVKNLQNTLYFVYPADCTDCNNSKNDILFRQWEDGSKDRPRLVPAGSDVIASYRIDAQGVREPVQPESMPEPAPAQPASTVPDGTDAAESPEIRLRAQNATFSYGWVQLDAQLANKVQGYDTIAIMVYAPDGTLHDSFNYADRQGFFADRQSGEGNYRVVATYEYGRGTAKAELQHPIKFATPEFANLSATSDNGTVRLSGLLRGGLAGEQVSIEVLDPDGSAVKKYAIDFGTRPVFTLYIGSEEAGTIFERTGNYTFVVTHLPTGVEGRAVLFYDIGDGDTGISGAPINISENAGRSQLPAIAAQGDNVYVAWVNETGGKGKVLLAKSSDGGATFDSPAVLSESELFASSPDVAVSGGNVYVAWEDHDSDEQAAVAFRSSSDGGETFGETRILGNRSGEGLDPQVVALGSNVYVAWISGAFEEFAGRVVLATSSDGGGTFDLATAGENATDALAAGSGSKVYLAWQQYSLRDVSRGNGTNMFATLDGGDLQASEAEGLQGMTLYSMSASGSSAYVAGMIDGKVVIAGSVNGSFVTTEVADGEQPSTAASGSNVFVAWDDGGDIFLAASSDGGETFSEPVSVSNSEGQSAFPGIAASGSNWIVTWAEVAGEGNSNIMVAAQ